MAAHYIFYFSRREIVNDGRLQFFRGNRLFFYRYFTFGYRNIICCPNRSKPEFARVTYAVLNRCGNSQISSINHVGKVIHYYVYPITMPSVVILQVDVRRVDVYNLMEVCVQRVTVNNIITTSKSINH